MADDKIRVEITDESEAHCLKIVLQTQTAELPPVEIFLHTVQAVDLVHKLSATICALHHRDSERLIEAAKRYLPESAPDYLTLTLGSQRR